MKKILNSQFYIFLCSFLTLMLAQVLAFAQDSASSSAVTTTTTTQQTTTIQPWVWIVGGVVLLIIIIALARGKSGSGGSHTDKVTYTKTTSAEDNR